METMPRETLALAQAIQIAMGARQGTGQKSRDVWAYGQKHTLTPDSSLNQPYLHGPGGLLRLPGVDETVYSTVISSSGDWLSQIPWRGSNRSNPLFQVITGVTDGSGAEPSGPCDDAPVGGSLTAGIFTAPFGRLSRSTRQIDITRLGLVTDRADPMDLKLANSPEFLGFNGAARFPRSLTNEFQNALFGRAIEFVRELTRQFFEGSTVNNNVGGGYKEFNGLNRLISTTPWVDAELGTAIPAAYPYIVNANYRRIDTTVAGVYGMDWLIAALTNMARQLTARARLQRMNPVRWALVMSEDLFYILTSLWPCRYYLGGCTVTDSAGQRINIDAKDAIDLRDQMRTGKFLIMDGVRWEVMHEPAQPELSNTTSSSTPSGCFASDIYFVPMSVLGGQAVTFAEYHDYSEGQIADFVSQGMVLARPTDGGMFLESPRQKNLCIQFQATIEARLIMRTPWLAGRIQNVVYCPVQHLPQAFPDQPYLPDGGGITSRSGPSLYGD